MLAALTGTEVVVRAASWSRSAAGSAHRTYVPRRLWMVEIGATNKTHVRDFHDATTDSTKAYLKVHPSSRIEGNVDAIRSRARDLADAASDVLVLDDLGSGLLTDHPLPGLVDEPGAPAASPKGASPASAETSCWVDPVRHPRGRS